MGGVGDWDVGFASLFFLGGGSNGAPVKRVDRGAGVWGRASMDMCVRVGGGGGGAPCCVRRFGALNDRIPRHRSTQNVVWDRRLRGSLCMGGSRWLHGDAFSPPLPHSSAIVASFRSGGCAAVGRRSQGCAECLAYGTGGGGV